MKIRNFFLSITIGIFITACENDDGSIDPMPSGDYVNGILVSNEGPFNNGTGTVSYISEDLTTVENSIYNAVNASDLGNIVQSIGFEENLAFIVANNSNTVTVVDRYTFEKIATIADGLNNPRYFLAVNGKGYVTNWGDPQDETDDFVAIIDLETNKVVNEIAVAFGPEEITAGANFIYVAHQGGFGYNNVISVIDTGSNAVSSTIEVGYVPNSMQFDAEGNLWVLSGGKPSFADEETAGSLSKINTQTNAVASTFDFGLTEHPNHLAFEGDTLFYGLNGTLYNMAVSDTALSEEGEIDNLSMYAMTVKDGKLYATDAKDFASNGTLSIYDLTAKAKMETFDVGIIPGGIYFNR